MRRSTRIPLVGSLGAKVHAVRRLGLLGLALVAAGNLGCGVEAGTDPGPAGTATAQSRGALLGLANVDLGVTITDGATALSWGASTTYTIVVGNAGPDTATNATLTNVMTALISSVTWTCTATGGGSCPSSGSGAITGATFSLPKNATATFTVTAQVQSGSGLGTLVDTATAIVAPLTTLDLDLTNNVAIDSDSINVARTLNVTKTGAANGTVSAFPAVFVPCIPGCGSASGVAVNGTTLTLTATPIAGASFFGWGGACASAGTATTCSLPMNSDNSVTATFLPPPSISAVSGGGQTTATGAAFASPLTVKVVDSGGAAVSGVTVTFSAPVLGAAATFSSPTAVTAANGTASVTATANATPGPYSATATIAGGSSATFALTNYGAPATVSVVAGSSQSATVGTGFVQPLTVIVRDLAGDPVPGATVNFSAPLNAAGLSSTSVTTDANGQASVTGTAGNSALTYAVTASSGLAVPASFLLSNLPGAAAQITILSGSGQSATVGTAFANPLTVAVVDALGNIVVGVPVTFTAAASGASATLSAQSALTNILGASSVTATANSIAGSYTVTASILGLPLVSFSLTNTAGGAAAIQVQSGNAQTTTTGTAFTNPLVVRVIDGSGNPVAGATVSFGAPATGASATFSAPTALTAANGTAQVTATANATTGSYVATGSVAGVTTPASFSLTNQALIAISPASKTVAPLGAVTFTASGGSGSGYVFSLASAPSGGTIDPTTGIYVAGATPNVTDVVNVRDGAGHLAAAQVHVGSALTATIGVPQVAPGGSATIQTSGGSGTGLSFSVTTNNSGATIDSMGNYKAGRTGNVTDVVTVTDSLGNSTTVSIPVGPPVSLSGGATTVAPGATTTFGAVGGSGTGFTFGLSSNASGGSINPTTGVYTAGSIGGVTDTVSVTDSLGNVATGNVSVGAGVALTPATASVAPGGTVTLTPSGGSGSGYTFAVTTNNSGGTIGATTGVYVAGSTPKTTDTVTVTDSLGNKATASISVGGGLTITPSSANVAPRGSLTFVAGGGSGAGYTFTLSTNGSGGTIAASTGIYAAGSTGSTTDVVLVTDSLGNTASATVTVGAPLVITPTNVSVTPLGVVPFTVSGGSGAGYTYSVKQGTGTINASTGLYVASLTGNGTDVVQVKDSLGNTATANVNVGLGIAPSGPSSSGAITVAPRGSAQITVTGGTPPYSYSLTLNGSGATIDGASGAYVAGPTPLRTDIVTIKDQNGAATAVMVNVGPGVSLSPALPIATAGQSITFSASGGSGTGYTYAIATNASGATINATTGVYMAGTTTGADTVTATDSLGNVGSVVVAVGGLLVVNPTVALVAPGGTITFSPSGGSGGYKYSLSINSSGGHIDANTGVYVAGTAPGAVDTVLVTDSAGAMATAVVTVGLGVTISPRVATISPSGTLAFSAQGGIGLGYTFSLSTNGSGGTITAAGAYKAGTAGNTVDVVKVSDLLGNSDSATITVGASLTLTASASTVPPRGSATFIASGGSGGYTFVMHLAGSGGHVTSTTGAYVAGNVGGTQDVVQVTDSLGNTATQSISVGAGLSITPAAPTVEPGAKVTFQTAGGSGTGVQFMLLSNASGGTLDANTGAYVAGATSGVFDVVQAADSLGNLASVHVVVGPALSVSADSLTTPPRGQVTIVPMGGTGGYHFQIGSDASGGTLNAATGVYVAGATGNVTDTVIVLDSSGVSVTVSIKVGPGVSMMPATANVGPGGPLTFSAMGGSGTGYQFAFATNASGGTLDAGSGAYRAGATSGIDHLQVTDSLGNVGTATVEVGAALTVSIAGGVDTVPPRGTLMLSASGGTAPLSFAVSTNKSGASINPMTGIYVAGATGSVIDTVTVTDANASTATVQINVGPPLTITASATQVAAGGKITLQAMGGSGTGLVWSVGQGSSGGSIAVSTSDPAQAIFTAGTKLGTDSIQVVDSLGNMGTLSFAIAAQMGVGNNLSLGGGGCAVAGGSGHGAATDIGWLALALGLLLGRRTRSRQRRRNQTAEGRDE